MILTALVSSGRITGSLALLAACVLFALPSKGYGTPQASPATDNYSAASLFNQGNAQFRSGKFAQAILDYERAHLLDPRDQATEVNLKIAREKAGIPTSDPTHWEKLERSLGWNEIAYVGSAGLALMCLALFVRRVSDQPRLRRQTSPVLVLGICVLAVALAVLALRWSELHRAVVTTPGAIAHIAPADDAAKAFDLREGDTVIQRKTHGPFVLVGTSDGHSGWVAEGQITPIIPR